MRGHTDLIIDKKALAIDLILFWASEETFGFPPIKLRRSKLHALLCSHLLSCVHLFPFFKTISYNQVFSSDLCNYSNCVIDATITKKLVPSLTIPPFRSTYSQKYCPTQNTDSRSIPGLYDCPHHLRTYLPLCKLFCLHRDPAFRMELLGLRKLSFRLIGLLPFSSHFALMYLFNSRSKASHLTGISSW